jgi:hypothetical protein
VTRLERLALLRDISAGRVYRSESGRDFIKVRNAPARRCERSLRVLLGEGVAHLGTDGWHYELTPAGIAEERAGRPS